MFTWSRYARHSLMITSIWMWAMYEQRLECLDCISKADRDKCRLETDICPKIPYFILNSIKGLFFLPFHLKRHNEGGQRWLMMQQKPIAPTLKLPTKDLTRRRFVPNSRSICNKQWSYSAPLPVLPFWIEYIVECSKLVCTSLYILFCFAMSSLIILVLLSKADESGFIII